MLQNSGSDWMPRLIEILSTVTSKYKYGQKTTYLYRSICVFIESLAALCGHVVFGKMIKFWIGTQLLADNAWSKYEKTPLIGFYVNAIWNLHICAFFYFWFSRGGHFETDSKMKLREIREFYLGYISAKFRENPLIGCREKKWRLKVAPCYHFRFSWWPSWIKENYET